LAPGSKSRLKTHGPTRPGPRSAPRLCPRASRAQLLLALLLAAGVFIAVPRGVSVGTLDMHSIRMHFNASTMVRV
jgi:hypothetical protein